MSVAAESRRPHETHHDHYDHYDIRMLARLDGFYGRVEAEINRRIAKHVHGKSVLDVGCGFGSLVSFLTNAGFEAKGVDSLESFLEAGRQRFPGVDLRTNSRYAFPFLEKSFDTVIMKEVIHHVADESDEDRFLAEVRRVCKRRLIVFDPNPTLILQATRRMLRHVDPICAPETAKTILARAGFETKSLEFTELLAFPLSGGYISPVLLPNLELVRASVLRLDRLLMKLARWTRLDSRLCWRYLLVADLAG